MLFSIEGNIGSGKSTLIRALKNEFTTISDMPVIFVDEPVAQWETIQSEDGKNMIELFYGNPTRYSFAFQMMAYISRLSLLQEAIKNHPKAIIITERCLLTDYFIFAKLLYENKSMLKEEYEIYQRWFHSFQDIPLHGIIYVRTDVKVAFERCKLRSRPGESIDEAYLKQCHDKHEEWIQEECDLIIDNNITEQEEALWMIHDYISDMVWQYKEPTIKLYDYVFMYWIVCMGVFYFINTLNFQKNNQSHSDWSQI